MGILAEPLRYIEELKLAPGFSVCELGDQFITSGETKYLAREWYERRGCARYVSVDANGRNGAVVFDLNKPLLRIDALAFGLGKGFDLVTDFGTGEHIFDQRQVWETMHDLCNPGGFIVFDRPTAGYEGHCFYLIQWNVISALAHANDYAVVRLEEHVSTRGILLRGVLRKSNNMPFVVPQQGRYVKDLVIDAIERTKGPDWKSRVLRSAGVIQRKKK